MQYTIILYLCFLCNALPASFSWDDIDGISYMPPVKNQNFPQPLNSGWAISAVSVLDARIKILTKAQIADISLSAQLLISCCKNDFSENLSPEDAYKWILLNNITDESCNPYQALESQPCNARTFCTHCNQSTCFAVPDPNYYSINSFKLISGVNEMMNEIYNRGPIACSIYASPSLRDFKGSKVFEDASGGFQTDHYVTVFGWGEKNGTQYWNILNSWGSFWAEAGSFRLIKGTNNLGIQNSCFAAEPKDIWNIKSDYGIDSIKIGVDQLTVVRDQSNPAYSNVSLHFAVVSIMQDKLRFRLRFQKQNIQLSPQALINCQPNPRGVMDLLDYIHNNGIPQESCQNYIAQTQGVCNPLGICGSCRSLTPTKYECTPISRYNRWYWTTGDYGIMTPNNVDEMIFEIQSFGPILCGMYASESFKNYKGGIITESKVYASVNHYVELIGLEGTDQQKYWVGKNSWGTSWGEDGFFKISFAKNTLLIQSQCYWLGTPEVTNLEA